MSDYFTDDNIIQYNKLGMEPEELLDADIKAFNGELGPLIDLIHEHISRYE